jgi:hypothetical protein
VATALTGLIIIAKYDLVSKCIVAFRGTRRASVEYFIPGGGWKKIDAPTVEDLIKIFRETDRIVLVPSAETAPQEQPKKEMGFHAKN